MLQVGLMVFLIGIIGFIVNPKSLIQLILSLELIILGGSQVALDGSLILNDIDGQLYTIYIISIAGAESAIALAIVVTFYRLRGTIRILP